MQMTHPLRLLVVDDSPEDAELVTATLAHAGFECGWSRVEDEAGLERALREAPDIVVCDHYMPRLTVARVAELVSGRDPDCPMIVVSGQLEEQSGVALIDGVCRDFVRKDALHRLPAAVLREVGAAEARRRLRGALPEPAAGEDAALESALRQALAAGQLALHYQPQVDLRSGRLVGFEALARWQPPGADPVPPARFVGLAERSELALELGRWALASACRQLAEWTRAGHRELRVSVNLSGRHFLADGVVELVNGTLAASGVDPRQLQIEITENSLIGNVERAAEAMRRLASLGVHFALDDFGTGYSSLAYLRRFPIDEIKVDRSFVAEMTERADDAVLVRTIIAMAHTLGARVVAEGIETEAQLAALRRARCDVAQGYLLGRPAPAQEATALLGAMSLLPAGTEAPPARTLLIVDDEPNIASSLKRLLRHDGYRILTAQSAAQGFELLATHDVGVIISDQRMPEMCGTEFLAHVKDMYPGTLRMVLSGFTDLESVTGAINEGAIFKFLTKPWEDDAIRATVKDAFERHELLRDNERLAEEARRANRELSEANARLEQRVAQKTAALELQLAVLRVSQEALDRLPLGVVGLDAEGMVAAANEYAVMALGALPGAPAAECLPQPLLELVARAEAAGEAAGAYEDHRAICRPMRPASGQRSWLLVAIPPATQEENQP